MRPAPRFLLVLALLGLWFGLGRPWLRGRQSRPAAPAALPGEFTARAISVADGDTLDLEHAGRRVRVRLFGLDAPEADQPHADAARTLLRELTRDRDLRVVVRDRDRYGRVVAALFTGRDSVNARLVREGAAWAYVQYSDRYVADEQRARRERRGLWRGRDPVPPWTWRGRSGANPRNAGGLARLNATMKGCVFRAVSA